MKSIKLKKTFCLDNISSISYDNVVQKVKNFIIDHASSFSKTELNLKNNRIILQEPLEKNAINILNDNNFDINKYVLKHLIRTIKLNVTFDKESKSLVLTNDNVENFKDANTISYNIVCDNIQRDALFFHESSLVDYHEDYDIDDFKKCRDALFILFFDENISIYNKISQQITNTKKENILYLCYNLDNQKLYNDSYSCINKQNVNDIKKLIREFNTANSLNEQNYINIIDDDLSVKTIKFNNFKYFKSDFILFNKSMDHFINFKDISNSNIFNNFLNSIKNNVIII